MHPRTFNYHYETIWTIFLHKVGDTSGRPIYQCEDYVHLDYSGSRSCIILLVIIASEPMCNIRPIATQGRLQGQSSVPRPLPPHPSPLGPPPTAAASPLEQLLPPREHDAASLLQTLAVKDVLLRQLRVALNEMEQGGGFGLA